MKKILIVCILSCAILGLSRQSAKACDPNCDAFTHIIVGGTATLGTIIISPAIGALLFDDPKPPYLKALGLTSLTSFAAFGIGLAVTGPSDEHVNGIGQAFLAALPIIAGVTTTTIVYNKSKRKESPEKVSQAGHINLGIRPVPHGASVTMIMTL